jgi:hypothetical protein
MYEKNREKMRRCSQRIYSIRILGSGRDDLKRAHGYWFFII